uniref:Uncharacterized protein n=1 Tax=Rhizophora mucronata TaxID=61149 RepID=A0A2P2QKI9_RHIMU
MIKKQEKTTTAKAKKDIRM